jgi:hypothetical protein
MYVQWYIDGHDWRETVYAPINSEPIEICTLGIESLIKKRLIQPSADKLNFGLAIIVHHENMLSQNEHFVCYSPLALSNAGYYKLSKLTQDKIKNILDIK